MDAGQRQRTDQSEIWDYYAQSDSGRVFAPMGLYCPAAREARDKSEAGASGKVAGGGISGNSPQGHGAEYPRAGGKYLCLYGPDSDEPDHVKSYFDHPPLEWKALMQEVFPLKL